MFIALYFAPRSISNYGWEMSFYHIYGIGYIFLVGYILTLLNKRNISTQAVVTILLIGGTVISISLNWHYFNIRGDFFEYTGSDSLTIKDNIDKYSNYGLFGFWEKTKYSWDDSAIVMLGYLGYGLTGSVIGFKLLNIIPYILSSLFIIEITKKGLIALLWGFNPVVLYYLSSGLKEMWFSFFIIWFVYLVKVSRSSFVPVRTIIGLFISGFRYPTSLFILVSNTRFRLMFIVALMFSTLIIADLFPAIHYLNLTNTEVALRSDISASTKQFLTVVNGLFGPLPTFHGGKTGYNLVLWSYGLLPLPILGKKLVELTLSWKHLNSLHKMMVSFIVMSMVSLMLVGRVYKARYLMPYLGLWICLLPIDTRAVSRKSTAIFYFLMLIVVFIWNYRR